MKTVNKCLKLILIIFFSMQITNATSKEALMKEIKDLTYKGYFQFDNSHFINAIGLCERIKTVNPEDAEAIYYSAYSGYRILNIGMVREEASAFNNYYDKTINEASKLFDNKQLSSEAYVVAASAVMMKLAVDKSDAPNLSAKTHGYLDNAEKKDKNNPRIYLTRGIMFYNTPVQFGGGVEKAIKQFEIALKLFENNEAENQKISWGHAETYAWKGQAYLRGNEVELSKQAYEKALNIEPNFGWVEYQLLPQLENASTSSAKSEMDSQTEAATTEAESGTLKIVFENFESNEGKLSIGLHNSKQGYNDNKPFQVGSTEIKNQKVIYSFENIPFGEYAVKCYHDENSNNELDTNLFGIPSEAYGFSNNARGSFGPPDYVESKFNFDSDGQQIKIKLD